MSGGSTQAIITRITVIVRMNSNRLEGYVGILHGCCPPDNGESSGTEMENGMDTGGNHKNSTGRNTTLIILAHPCDLWSSV